MFVRVALERRSDRIRPRVEIARRLVSGGIRELTLADTVGAADPRTVGERVARVANELPNVPLSLHVHDTAGYGLANVYAASTAGVATFEGALAGLGGCPFAPGATGNLDLVKMARFLPAAVRRSTSTSMRSSARRTSYAKPSAAERRSPRHWHTRTDGKRDCLPRNISSGSSRASSWAASSNSTTYS